MHPVPPREERFGSLRVQIVGGEDRQGGGTGPVVVLLHGFGASGDDLVPLHRQLDVPHEVRFVFPEAPLDLGRIAGPGYAGGRAWWMIDLAGLEAAARGDRRPDRSGTIPEGLVEARAQVTALLGEITTKLHAPMDRIVLGGFSQGAMLALDTALHAPSLPAALVLMSGTLIAEPEWTPLLPRLAGLPILQSHGRSDPLLPFDTAVRLRDLLKGAEAEVHWLEFAGGHTIPGSALDTLGELIRRVAER